MGDFQFFADFCDGNGRQRNAAAASGGGIHLRRKDKTGDTVAKSVDLERRMRCETDALIALERAAIARLQNKNHYNILLRRYVLCLTFERIAEKMDYTLSRHLLFAWAGTGGV